MGSPSICFLFSWKSLPLQPTPIFSKLFSFFNPFPPPLQTCLKQFKPANPFHQLYLGPQDRKTVPWVSNAKMFESDKSRVQVWQWHQWHLSLSSKLTVFYLMPGGSQAIELSLNSRLRVKKDVIYDIALTFKIKVDKMKSCLQVCSNTKNLLLISKHVDIFLDKLYSVCLFLLIINGTQISTSNSYIFCIISF
jgi:hypothetical protein